MKLIVREILNLDIDIQIGIVKKENDSFKIKKMDIKFGETEKSLKKLFKESILYKLENTEEQIVDISTSDGRKGVIYRYDYEEDLDLVKLIKEFNPNEFENLEIFGIEEKNFNDIYGFLISLGTNGKHTVIYKHKHNINIIKKDKLFFLREHKSRFVLDKADNLRMNDKFDAIYIEKELYFFDVKFAERYFGMMQSMRNRANNVQKEIEKLDILEDIKMLGDIENNEKIIKNLSKIDIKTEIFNLGYKKIIEFSKNKNYFKEQFEYSECGKIKLSNNKQRQKFIKLLKDNFLHSELTDLSYEALAKDKLDKS